MNLRQLKYFARVVEAGNMTRAAEQLHVAQTALGMQIRQMEEDLGVALLIRHSRGVEPTRAGQLLHAKAMAILKLVEETRQEVLNCGREDGEVIRLGTTPALMPIVGPYLAVHVHEKLPQVLLNLVEEMSHVLVRTLIRGELDLILCYDVPDLSSLLRTPLFQDDLVLVTIPGPHAGEPILFVDALEERLAMPEPGDTVRNAVARAAGEVGLELRIAYQVRSIAAMKRMVKSGASASILPFVSVIDEVRSRELDARPIIKPAIRRTLFLASSKQRVPFRNEAGLRDAVRASLKGVTDALGPLAHPL